jgi:PD-(D/E)XK endonuclease
VNTLKSSNDEAAEISAKTAKQPHRGRNTKRTGELSEAAFLLKAESLGFKLAKPWGDSERYDFILDNGRRLWRIQVKCTAYLRLGGYDVQPVHTDRAHKSAYTPDDIDFLVAHIIPLDVWYVVPIEAMGPGMSLRFYPEGNCKHPRFEKYREAWHLLGPPKNQPAENLQKLLSENPDNPLCTSVSSLLKNEPETNLEPEEEEGEEPEITQEPQQPQLKWTPIWRPIWNPKIFGR